MATLNLTVPNPGTPILPPGPTGSSFTQKLLSITFQLFPTQGSTPPVFTGSQSNTLTLKNVRASAKIIKAGGRSMGQLFLDVYGMTLDQMNDLSTFGQRVQLQSKNQVFVQAGDASGGLATVFQGTIRVAYGDFAASPEVPFRVEANTGLFQAVAPAAVTSYNGGVTAAVVMSNLATLMGMAFENNGVATNLPSPYFWGTLRQQADAAASQGNFNWTIDNGAMNNAGTLVIWPKNGSRNTAVVPTISPTTGMIGYPIYNAMGVTVKTLFNPQVGLGGKVQISGSQLKAANGTFSVFGLDHALDTLLPHGKWESTIQAYRLDQANPVPAVTTR